MNRIDRRFKELKRKKQKAFIAYITCGDPDLRVTKQLITEMDKKGVDLIELGIPFSDPLADGPTIQAASQRALSNGVTFKSILRMIGSLRENLRVPLVFMTYYNIVLQYGLEKFVDDAKLSGVDGVIVPDLPYEESGPLQDCAGKKDFAVILLLAPTSTSPRIKKIAKKSSGFIYYVSLTGVTGARKKMAGDISAMVKKIKRFTTKPVCVGFGVSDPGQAKNVALLADGVIVGSAIIRKLEDAAGKNPVEEAVAFIESIARSVHSI